MTAATTNTAGTSIANPASPIPAANTTAAPPAPPKQTLDPLYTSNPGSVDVKAPTPATSYDATAGTAAATTDTAVNGSVPAAGDVSTQLNNITSQDSPYVKLARQSGMLAAAKRGLGNSSIAAGNSEAAAVAAAMPAAQQNASQEATQALANQSAQNTAAGLNAQLGTSVSTTNAANQTDVSKQNAQLKTQNSQFNSSQDFAAKMQNATSANQMRQLVVSANADLNKQYLANSGAKDLATINGEYQALLGKNTQASQMFDSYMTTIGTLMQNTAITPDAMATRVGVLEKQLEAGLKLINGTDTIDWAQFGNPTVPPTPTLPGGGGGARR